ncbi:hypothetical protein BBJ28_00019345 [Nothophytophthora sp. Chile5]|nr:hypothetical protein BBJ28_00019345 [Nothophytophthora sp. Chile5]
MAPMSSDGGGDQGLALDELLDDFKIDQRQLLRVAVDKVIETQSAILDVIKNKVEARHRQAVDELRDELRDELARPQPSMLDTVINETLDAEKNPGLVSWVGDDAKRDQALGFIIKLREHLLARQGNAFRSDFEALLVVYMEYLEIPMEGTGLGNRIHDFKAALHEMADLHENAASTYGLVNLVYRVRWACNGVRTIGNARSHDATPLSASEMLELCGCFSAIGAAMPDLALKFEVCKPPPVAPPAPQSLSSDVNSTTNGTSGLDVAALVQHLQAGGNGGQVLMDMLLQSLAARGVNDNSTVPSPSFQETRVTQAPPLPPLPPGVNGILRVSSPASPSPPDFNGSTSQSPPLLPGFNGSTSQAPPLPPGSNGSIGGSWIQPQPALPPSGSPQKRSPHPSPSGSPQKRYPPTQATGFAMKQADVPSVATLKLVPSFKFYHDRPTELPKESDRVRMAMFARMRNHTIELPKATLCPFQQDHDASCPFSHTYLEVMTYNPLFKRLICRQPSHYYSRQVQESDECVCIHVDTGLKWEWMEELRGKRTFCRLGAKCTNSKCIKSHSFEEMCWYNPSYKTRKCAVRAHDHIVRARGTIMPPLDCNYYHIEEGKNTDKREFNAEDDHVGRPVKMLFAERSHKPLADALEALRYARANNL